MSGTGSLIFGTNPYITNPTIYGPITLSSIRSIFSDSTSGSITIGGHTSVLNGGSIQLFAGSHVSKPDSVRISVDDVEKYIQTGTVSEFITPVRISDTTVSSSTTTGALVVGGGIATGAISYFGGDILFPQSTTLRTTTSGNNLTLSTAGSGTVNTGVLFRKSSTVTNTSGLSSVTNIQTTFAPTTGSGALTFLTIGGTLNQTGSTGIITGIDINPFTVTSITGTLYGLRSQIAATPSGGGTAYNIYADGTAANLFAGQVSITNTISSTSSTTGALIVTGGVGIGGALNIGSTIKASNLEIATGKGLTVSNTMTLAGTDLTSYNMNGIPIIVKVTLTASQILLLNTSPVNLIAEPGVGKIIQLVSPLVVVHNFVTAAYATNTTLNFSYGGNITTATNNTLLTTTATRLGYVLIAAYSNTGNNIVSNTAFRVAVGTGNPTGGGGSLDIYLTYRILTL
jgi:hypothetical protein